TPRADLDVLSAFPPLWRQLPEANLPVQQVRQFGCHEPLRSRGLSNPTSVSVSECPASCSANRVERIRAPTSMFRVWAASVKLADVTSATRRSTTIHFACRLDRLTASRSSDRGS